MKQEFDSFPNSISRGLKSAWGSVKEVGSGNKDIQTGSLLYGRSSKLIFKFKKKQGHMAGW